MFNSKELRGDFVPFRFNKVPHKFVVQQVVGLIFGKNQSGQRFFGKRRVNSSFRSETSPYEPDIPPHIVQISARRCFFDGGYGDFEIIEGLL